MDTIKKALEEIKARTKEYLYKSIELEKTGNTTAAKKYIHKAKGLNESALIIIYKLLGVK